MLEIVLLIVAILLFVSILMGRIGKRLGIPVLVLFLGVGMLFGSDGFGIVFNSMALAEAIGTVALCIILFSGGLNTNFKEIKPIIGQSIVLATIGVVCTATLTGLFAWWLCGEVLPSVGISLLTAFLMAAVMSSTDSAAVFAILGSKNVQLKHNLRPTLEFESGSNDPMAYMLTITLIGLIKAGGEPNIPMIVLSIITQIAIGTAVGYLMGRLAVYILNKVKIDNDVYYPIIVFTFCIFIFSFTHFAKGNGYLAVYLGGMIIGNSKFVTRRGTIKMFDAISWLSQILMFITLGLLVNPRELLPIAGPALLIGLFMMFVARPISVFISLFPFKKVTFKDKVFLSWVGLRGAVPIIFSIFPFIAGVPHAQFIFNIVFFITFLSIVLQGTFLTQVAAWLGLLGPSKVHLHHNNLDVDLPKEVASFSLELEVTEYALRNGNKLIDMPLPDKTLVVMVKRTDKYFAPNGKTKLYIGDKLSIMTNNEAALLQTFHDTNVPESNSK